jgi:hypothetical protein
VHGDECGFVEVDREPGGSIEVVQDPFEGHHRSMNDSSDDESVVGVL